MPAQLTSTRSGPSSSAASRAAATAAESVTSAGANRAAPSRPAATCSPAELGRSTSTALAPALTSRRAVASPSPLAPPVTTATLPSMFTLASSPAQLPEPLDVAYPSLVRAGQRHRVQRGRAGRPERRDPLGHLARRPDQADAADQLVRQRSRGLVLAAGQVEVLHGRGRRREAVPHG